MIIIRLLLFGVTKSDRLMDSIQSDSAITWVVSILYLAAMIIVICNWKNHRRISILLSVGLVVMAGIVPMIGVFLGIGFLFLIFGNGSDKGNIKSDAVGDKSEEMTNNLYDEHQKREAEREEMERKYRERQEALSRARKAAHYAKGHVLPAEWEDIEKELNNLESRYHEYDDPSDVEDFINKLP